MPDIHYSRGLNGPRRVFLAVPAYSGSVGARCVMSLTDSVLLLSKAGISVDMCIQTGNCHVDDARNAMVRQFLMTDCADMVFIDEDIGFDCADLLKLLSYDRDLVAGVYPCKQMEEEYPVLPLPGEIWSDREGLVEVQGAPTGFMRMRRSMIEKMVAKYGHRSFIGRGQDPDEIPHYILFERTYEGGQRASGDYAFCKKWRTIGGKVYVDPEMRFSHSGQHTWSGSLGDHWKRVHGVYAAENDRKFSDAVARLKSGVANEQTFTWLRDGWGNDRASAPPELLAVCWRMARETPGPILECGPGLSTIVMALANPRATIYALENDPIWATKLRDVLQEHDITNVVLSCHALKAYDDGNWYDTRDLPDGGFSLVMCDGPWRTIGRRDLLLIVVADRLSGADFIIDDTYDETHTAAFRAWAARAGRQIEFLGNDPRGKSRFAVSVAPKLAQAAE